MKLNPKQLRKLIETTINEKFGAWDVENRVDLGDGDTMMPHNFEEAAKEIFAQSLQGVVQTFVDKHMEMVEAGMPPESHESYEASLEDLGHELHEALMNVIAKYSDKFIEESL